MSCCNLLLITDLDIQETLLRICASTISAGRWSLPPGKHMETFVDKQQHLMLICSPSNTYTRIPTCDQVYESLHHMPTCCKPNRQLNYDGQRNYSGAF
ncbi:hypothetical protein EVAR_101386_1 [Eumeta japonica]|uniref:Uncharacterized protein n=1 Tax=Eumeta variegata TaxID=151549 RepID=A0A4C1STA2_EUMVA|nr:hypothetical protein EVAR_101386_1 [Eumeta japonica]